MVPSAPEVRDAELLNRVFLAEGLIFLGIAEVPLGDPEAEVAREQYHQWLTEGRHGTMVFLERHEAGKYDANFVLEGARSVIIAGLGYLQPRPTLSPASGLVAKYAWGRDYHKVLLAKLRRVAQELELAFPNERWKSFTDTAPLDERWWASRAGASFTARNAMAINRKLGSWFLLGEIVTSQTFVPTASGSHLHGSCPSGCHRCRDVCPTGALDTDGRIDAKKCIS